MRCGDLSDSGSSNSNWCLKPGLLIGQHLILDMYRKEFLVG